MNITYNDQTTITTNNDYIYATTTIGSSDPNYFTTNAYNYITKNTTNDFIKPYTMQIKNNIHFKKVIERNPNRVYEFIFQDNTHIKTICAEEDLEFFDLKYAFFLALAKYLYKDKYTFTGILNKVPDLMQNKKYIKIVKEGMKLFKEEQEKEEKEKAKEKELKEIKKRKIAKAQERRKRKKEREIDLLVKALQNAK